MKPTEQKHTKSLLSDGPSAKDQADAMTTRLTLRNATPDLLRIVQQLDRWQTEGAQSISFSALSDDDEFQTIGAAISAAIAKAKGQG